MPPLFKDFPKDAKDLVEKNYSAANSFKLESKYKGKDSEVFINPQVETKKEVEAKVDVEYNVKQYGLKTKSTFTRGSIVPNVSVTYEADGHKVELQPLKREVSYEYKADKFALADKLTEGGVTASIAFEAVKGVSVGAEAEYSFKNYAVAGWSAGAQYKHSSATVSVTTKALKSYTTGIYAPINGTPLPDLKVAVYADCYAKADPKNKTKVVVGTEFGCPCGTGCTLRFKLDNNFAASLAVIRKFGDGWKAALTAGFPFNGVGIYIVRE